MEELLWKVLRELRYMNDLKILELQSKILTANVEGYRKYGDQIRELQNDLAKERGERD